MPRTLAILRFVGFFWIWRYLGHCGLNSTDKPVCLGLLWPLLPPPPQCVRPFRDGMNSDRARTRDGTFSLFSCTLNGPRRVRWDLDAPNPPQKKSSPLPQMVCEKNCNKKNTVWAASFNCGRCPRWFGYDYGILQSSLCHSVRAVKHLNWSPEKFGTATPLNTQLYKIGHFRPNHWPSHFTFGGSIHPPGQKKSS